jgi:hypothetical protein
MINSSRPGKKEELNKKSIFSSKTNRYLMEENFSVKYLAKYFGTSLFVSQPSD